MKRSPFLFPTVGICLVIVCIIFLFALHSTSIGVSWVERLFAPLQKTTLQHTSGSLTSLQKENIKLKTQLAHMQLVQQQNKALQDQFQPTADRPLDETVNNNQLLPANVVGRPEFFPGISAPEELIIDRGSSDGIKTGNAVIDTNILVGKITKTNTHFSEVLLTTNTAFSLTGKTITTNALGVVKGQGSGQIILDNVVLADQLKSGDTVVSAGDQGVNGQGIPPGLIIGKIASIQKNPSALFQQASISTFLPVEKLSVVFIVMQ